MKRKLRTAVVVLLFVCLFLWVNSRWQIGPSEIKEFVISFGWAAPFLFILLYILTPFVFFPASILSLSAGITYGVWPGVLFIWLGATGAAAAGYLVGKVLGERLASLRYIELTARLQIIVRKQGFLFVLVLRLVPLIGFGMLSYLSGWFNIRFRSYLSATMIGIIPGTFMYVTVGASLLSGDPVLLGMVAGSALILMIVIYFLRNKVRRWAGLPDGKERDEDA
ncbi:TVP38/TMEM64 family protein [Salimicrobium salexigens]|uniref:TVP38/TMEM64 family membrane protein n=1 Tax=Salimicrobium salexigens TaxID=908941 RepID=A0ABY1KQG0_9BACI|nr:VTT domain-containing protein [Salimicrobium salexigens]SIS46107.1 Uncharacterized membrane protein YdjX, TVP38/TMEM64 family, SNARE-associated domain [Salimicrobium salexigens]